VQNTKTFLDLNYWFHRSSKNHEYIYNMISETSSGISGFAMWGDFEETIFENIFTDKSIFRLLFEDQNFTSDFNEIHHKERVMDTGEFNTLPRRLITLLDTHYTNTPLHITVEDVNDEYDSILIDVDNEYPILELYLDIKLELNGLTPINVIPDEATFIDTHVNTFYDQTELSKIIILDVFYNYYNLEDGYEKYTHIMQNVETYHENVDNRSYYLMSVLFSFFILNKTLHRKIIMNESNIYQPDYWDND
jgi:hypothetical protein